MNHGRVYTYATGCRCAPCTAAKGAARCKYSARRKQRGLEADDERHGTTTGYNTWACRCDSCRTAHTTAARNRDRRKQEEHRRENPYCFCHSCKKHATLKDPHGRLHTYKRWGCRCDRCVTAYRTELDANRRRRRMAAAFQPAKLVHLVADILETNNDRSWTPQELRWEVNRIQSGNITMAAVRKAALRVVKKGNADSKTVFAAYTTGGKTNFTRRLSVRYPAEKPIFLLRAAEPCAYSGCRFGRYLMFGAEPSVHGADTANTDH